MSFMPLRYFFCFVPLTCHNLHHTSFLHNFSLSLMFSQDLAHFLSLKMVSLRGRGGRGGWKWFMWVKRAKMVEEKKRGKEGEKKGKK